MASFALSPFPGKTVGRLPSSSSPLPNDGARSGHRRRAGVRHSHSCSRSFRHPFPSFAVIVCALERPNKLARASSVESFRQPIPYAFYALASLALTLCKATVPPISGLKHGPSAAKRGRGEESASIEAEERGEFGGVLRVQGGDEFTPTEVKNGAEFGGVLRMQGGGVRKGESSTLMGLLKRGKFGGILRMRRGEELSLAESQKMGEFGGVLRMQGGGLGMALLSTTAIAKDQLSPVLATLLANPTFVSGAVAWAVAQVLKVFTTFFVERRWDFKMLLSSGGMPSSHSALCAALTMSVALCHGVGDALFPVCLGFSLIVMYDATGVRRHAGMQAEVLNLIVEDLFKGHPISEKKLKELLGHTPLQVAAGAFLGVLVGYFCSIGNSVIPGMGA